MGGSIFETVEDLGETPNIIMETEVVDIRVDVVVLVDVAYDFGETVPFCGIGWHFVDQRVEEDAVRVGNDAFAVQSGEALLSEQALSPRNEVRLEMEWHILDEFIGGRDVAQMRVNLVCIALQDVVGGKDVLVRGNLEDETGLIEGIPGNSERIDIVVHLDLDVRFPAFDVLDDVIEDAGGNFGGLLRSHSLLAESFEFLGCEDAFEIVAERVDDAFELGPTVGTTLTVADEVVENSLFSAGTIGDCGNDRKFALGGHTKELVGSFLREFVTGDFAFDDGFQERDGGIEVTALRYEQLAS